MMETIRIRQEGYAYRARHEDFFARFKSIAPSCTTLKQLVAELSERLSASAESWQTGTTKIFIKTELNEKLEYLLWLRYSSSARMLQRFWRHCLFRKHVIRLQTCLRAGVARAKFLRFKRRVILLQAVLRQRACRAAFRDKRGKATAIQKLVRGKLCRLHLRKLKNPYVRMAYPDLCAHYQQTETELQEAFAAQNFGVCEELESRLADIRRARSILLSYVPPTSTNQPAAVEPQSRQEVELYLVELRHALGYSRLHYEASVTAGLEQQKVRLEAMRTQFPTVEEVQASIDDTNKRLKLAMEKKDFRKCGEYRDLLTRFETQLDIARFMNSYSGAPPVQQLKERRIQLETELAEALELSQFETCDKLQSELDPLCAQLDALDKTPEEARALVADLTQRIDVAFSKLDFREMARLELQTHQLQLVINAGPVEVAPELSPRDILLVSLQGKSYEEVAALIPISERALEAAKAARDYKLCEALEHELAALNEVFSQLTPPAPALTRVDVEKRIAEVEAEITAALADKQYKQCDALNSELEKLKAKRAELPTSAEIWTQIEALEAELESSIRAKSYGRCEEIELKLAELRHAHAAVKASEPEEEVVIKVASVKSRHSMLHPTPKAGASKLTTEPLLVPISETPAKPPSVKPASEPTHVDRPVSKLRPKPPITLRDDLSVLEVAKAMSASRVDAALLVSAKGNLSGILTDNDITRRVLSQRLAPATTTVAEVMTKGPTCVHMADSALDALDLMVSHRFRHLPVLDEGGSVVGLLDIAKCLHDAISALEKVQESEDKGDAGAKIAETMVSALQKAGGKGTNKAQLAAMQAMMQQMFGDSIPTLRTILSKEHLVSVSVGTTVLEASEVMAAARKGVLVMAADGRELVGILTPKDLMNRVVAKGLLADTTLVSDVMTPNPECVDADLTLVDALREMHDHKFLHLPVKDSNGRVLGLVDVMELVGSTAGEGEGKGWRDFFGGAMAARDDATASDTASNRSGSIHTRPKVAVAKSPAKPPSVKPAPESTHVDRPVSKLRPKPPITLRDDLSVLEVAKAMSASRVDAALLVSAKGNLSGILTDNDITRRVLSQRLPPATTTVAEVMTKGPTCVHMADSALDALDLMVSHRFRHLPVLDESGSVVGLLDIAKCLHDAISALEKVQESEDKGDAGAKIAETMVSALQKAGGKGTNKAQLAAMQAMMQQMFGDSIPTLRTILSKEHLVSVIVGTTVLEASEVMAAARKGVLVMSADGRELVGILTPKDLMNRVVAKGLHADTTLVSDVMTPNPECVDADLTLVDALREMHDHKFLHLPVKDSNGRVLGLVDVMELVGSTAGEGEGKGWRDFFGGAMAARDDATASDTASNRSGSIHTRPKVTQTKSPAKPPSVKPAPEPTHVDRPVSKLRPKLPLLLSEEMTVAEVAETLANRRLDAGLLVAADNSLQGIITDNDITRRVVSQFLDPSLTLAKDVMTKGPTCVHMADSALDALDLMVSHRFRHLPVLDEGGSVVGLLDIAKCLHDAISALEKVQESEDKGDAGAKIAETMVSALQKAGGKGTNKAQLAAMQAMMQQMFGDSIPTLRTILGHEHVLSIKGSSNVREAATLMAQARKGILVMDGGDLVGILTPKDLMNRVVAKGKSPDLTAVSSVMTPNPECVSADMNLLDALREMHDHKFLHLPVKELDGSTLGVVDVMELVCNSAGGSGNGKGWRDFFRGAMEIRGDRNDDRSETLSEASGYPGPLRRGITVPARTRRDSHSEMMTASLGGDFDDFAFKLQDAEGQLHRLKSSSSSISALKQAVAAKLGCPVARVSLTYVDDEQDEVRLITDT